MNGGWVKLYRKTLENPVVCKDSDHAAVWMYLLLNATHKEIKIIFGSDLITLMPGQMITSRKSIGKLFSVSESKVERILKIFKSEQLIEQQTSNRNRLITILNWGRYQESEQPIEQQVNNKWTTSEQQVNTNKNVKNVKNEKKEDIYAQFVDGYHAICPSLSKVIKLTDTRKKAINRTIDEYGLETIKTVLTKAESSDFLTGRVGDFKASFDWIFKPSNFIKILEGNYDNRKSKQKSPNVVDRVSGTLETLRRMEEQDGRP